MGIMYFDFVRIIARKILREFSQKHPDSEGPLRAWHAEAGKAKWATTAEIKRLYKSASIINNSRVVFNIGGNKYRLIVEIKYEFQIVYIRFIGTHEQYDRIDVKTI